MELKERIHQVKEASLKLASSPEEVRNAALEAVCEALESRRDEIVGINQSDVSRAEAEDLPGPIIKRLRFGEGKIDDCIAGARDLVRMEDPLFKVLLRRQLDEGLELTRITCPIGVIGVIFESRPDALVQIACLCIKSGNGVVLKGGSEAKATNRVLYEVISDAGIKAGLPEGFALLLEEREEIGQLLKCEEDVDLLIPRGSNSFVKYIMDNTTIPVMGHADGICHVYVEDAADVEKAVSIVIDSKTQYPAACNAAETLLVGGSIADRFLPALAEAIGGSTGGSIELRGDDRTVQLIGCGGAGDEDDSTEYLDNILSIRVVDDMDEAVTHINRYGSHHTDCIVTENDDVADEFMSRVDSAGVYHNCSTRFADGFRYGFGAEVGISTGKLHARGPVGLEGLVTYKYKLKGNGHIVADYAEGRKNFDFKEMI